MRVKIFLLLVTACLLSAGAHAKTTLEWWQFWTDPGIKPTIDSLVAEFNQANPDIEVKVTDLTWADGQEKIVMAFASGTGPDVVELGSDWIAQFADNGHLADISKHIKADSGNFQGWSLSDYQGKIYGKPWILGTRIIFGNRDLLTKAGYEANWVPVGLPDLRQAAIKIRKLGPNTYGWGSNTAEKHRLYKKFLPFFWTAGGKIFTEDDRYCVISSAKAIASLQFYKMLHDSAGYVADQRGIEDAFLDGKVGFVLSGDWLLKRIELEHRKINLMTALFPGVGYPGRSFLGGEFLSVSAKSGHPDEAYKFIDFITSPKNQVRFCKANRSANPSSVQAQQDPYFAGNDVLQTFIKQIRFTNHPPVDPNWPAYEDIIEKAVEDAVFNGVAPANALHTAQVAITDVRKNAKK